MRWDPKSSEVSARRWRNDCVAPVHTADTLQFSNDIADSKGDTKQLVFLIFISAHTLQQSGSVNCMYYILKTKISRTQHKPNHLFHQKGAHENVY
jgi:hypothetical protein